MFSDNIISIVAGDEKPIKVAYEGDPIIHLSDPFDNKDLSQDFLYIDQYGMGIVIAGGNSGVGRYTLSN